MAARSPNGVGEPTDLRRAYLVLAVVGLTSFQTSMNLSIVFVVFPDLVKDFPNAGNAQLSWVLNIFSIVGAPTLVIAGALGERWGRKRTLLTGVVAFTVTSVFGALAPGPNALIVVRAVLALSASLILPMSATIVLREFPVSHRGIAAGTWSAIGGVAAAMGPSVGGFLVQQGGWRWAFWLNVPIGIVAFFACLLVLRESRDDNAPRVPDVIGTLALMAGIGATVFALVQSTTWGWDDKRTLFALGAGVVLLAYMLYRCTRHPAPAIELDLFRERTYGLGNIAMLTFSISFFASQFVSVLFLTQVWGYDVRDAGLLATPVFALTALMSPVAGRIGDRYGDEALVAPAALCWTAGIAVLAFGLDGDRNLPLWFVGITIAGIGSGLTWGGLFATVLRHVVPDRFAMAASISQTLQRIGNALGVALAVTVLGDRASGSLGVAGTFPRVFLMCAVFGFVTAVVMAVLRADQHRDLQRPAAELVDGREVLHGAPGEP
jgi:EmrB/QacA subfamily drug resistance transporter